MKNLPWILLAILLATSWAGFAASVGTSQNPINVGSGQSFVINVDLLDTTAIRGYSIRMAFDPAKLAFVSATRGSLFNGMPVNWWRIFNEEAGIIRIECIIFGEGLYVSGPGRLMNLNFTALADGYSDFSFLTVSLADPAGVSIPGSIGHNAGIIIGAHAYAGLKAFLQGPYLDGRMRTDINGILPLISPYDVDPVVLSAMPADAVDWGLIEIRQAATSTHIYNQSVLFHADGSLRTPGKPFLLLPQLPPGSYYLVLRHRNHLDMMSATAINFVGTGSPTFYDMSQISNVWGEGGVLNMGSGIYAMASGDADRDGGVYPTDRNLHWRLQAGSSGYKSADFNLDANVFPNDLNLLWRVNAGMSSRVPSTSGIGVQ